MHIKQADINNDPGLSDVNNTVTKFDKALKKLRNDYFLNDKLDAIVIAGDLTQDGKVVEYQEFNRIIASVFPSADVFGANYDKNAVVGGEKLLPILFIRGNHDNYPTNNNAAGKANYDANMTPKHSGNISDYREGGLYTYNIKGYDFIMVSQPNSAGNGVNGNLYDTASKSFTNAQVSAAIASNGSVNPIFLVTHPHMANTVYGSRSIAEGQYQGQSWGTSELSQYLAPYKNIVTFSGHSHYPILDERSISQDGGFTAIGTGSVNYMEVDTGYAESFHPTRYSLNYYSESNGLYIEVFDDNTTEVKRIDFLRGEYYKDGAKWEIKAANDPSWRTFTLSRDQEAPAFTAGAVPVISNITSNNCKVTFPQASDVKSDVDRYLIQYVRLSDNAVITSRVIWSHHFNGSSMPAELYWTLGDGTDNTGDTSTLKGYCEKLSSNTEYLVRVTAIDSFGNNSTPIISDSFTTTN